MVLLRGKEEVEYIVHKLDPYGVGLFTYTQTVQHLSSYMVPSENPRDSAPLPLLEKFANLLDLESRPWNTQAREEESE